MGWGELGWSVRPRGLHVRAGLQPILAVHDNLLTRLQAGIDQSLPLLNERDLHRADFDRQVLLDYESVGAVRSTLNDGSRHDDPALPRGHQQPRVDELPWPQMKFVVGES